MVRTVTDNRHQAILEIVTGDFSLSFQFLCSILISIINIYCFCEGDSNDSNSNSKPKYRPNEGIEFLECLSRQRLSKV